MDIVLATNNLGKLKEMQALFAPLKVNLRSQVDFALESVEETGATFVENALIKARYVAKETQLAAIADDSGLVVPCLDGQPGIFSARYAELANPENSGDEANNARLIRELTSIDAFTNPVPAYFYCAMAMLQYPNDPTPIIATAAWHGQIVQHPRGANGFGYDPYFLVAGMSETSAELPATVKNQLSHRAQASQQLLTALSNQPAS